MTFYDPSSTGGNILESGVLVLLILILIFPWRVPLSDQLPGPSFLPNEESSKLFDPTQPFEAGACGRSLI